MSFLKTYISIVDTINDRVGKAVSYVALLLMAVVVYEVVSRRFLSDPTIWGYEVILMIYGTHLMLVSAYGLLNNNIVAVDLITGRLSKKIQHILNLITYVLMFFPYIILTINPAITFFYKSYASNEHSWSVWAPPLAPIKLIIPITLVLLLLQGLSQCFKSIIFLAEEQKTSA